MANKVAVTSDLLFQRSVSENSLVAMDFSGRIGRVIDNPVEAQSAAMEEGHAWRVSSNNLCFDCLIIRFFLNIHQMFNNDLD